MVCTSLVALKLNQFLSHHCHFTVKDMGFWLDRSGAAKFSAKKRKHEDEEDEDQDIELQQTLKGPRLDGNDGKKNMEDTTVEEDAGEQEPSVMV